MNQTMRLVGRASALSLVAAALIAFGLCSSARADSFTLTVANANLATQGSGPYGTIEVTRTDGTHWHVLATGLNSFVFGDGGVIGLNIVSGAGAATLTLASCSSTCASGGAGTEDGFGSFSFTVNDGSGFSAPHSTFSFDFTTANAEASVADLLTATSQGAKVAAHMALSSNTACTGFAADGGTGGTTVSDTVHCRSVAEPSSLLFAGSALVLAGMLGRQWKRRR